MSDDLKGSTLPIIWENDFSNGGGAYEAAVFYPKDENASMDDRNAFARVLGRLRSGKPVERDELPEHLIVFERFKKMPKAGLPDFFWAVSVPVVSERVKTLFESFETGRTRFHEIRILGKDGETWLDGRWFIFNHIADTPCYVHEESNRSMLAGTPDYGYRASELRKEGDICVRADACSGRDCWTDPMLRGVLFFSDRMKRAIVAAKFKKPLVWRQCRVVG